MLVPVGWSSVALDLLWVYKRGRGLLGERIAENFESPLLPTVSHPMPHMLGSFLLS